MTREEAKQALDWFRNRSKTVTMPGAKRMYFLAIEALSADGDTISRQDAIDALMHEWDGMVTSVFDVVKSLPSAQPETHEKRTETHECDLIERQEAIDAVKAYLSDCQIEDADWHGNGIEYELESLPSAEPEIIRCKDCKWKNEHNCTRAVEVFVHDECYCSWAERRIDETD